jgi:hypothetical protein
MTPINAVSGWALAYKVLSGSTLVLHTHAEEKRVRVSPPEAERAQAGTG